MKGTSTQIITTIKRCLSNGIVPMIHGFSGIGKSESIHQIGKEAKLQLIDWRGSTADPTDLNGFPCLTGEKATYLPFDTFPIVGDAIPKGMNGWLLFADEINSAPPSVMKAMYKLILDRMVGNNHLHPKVYIIAAGNLATEGAMVNTLPSTLQSRMAHYELTVNAPEWIEWANKADVDYRMVSFISYKPELLHTFKLGHTDFTYACPRTIVAAAKGIKDKTVGYDDLLYLSGIISEGVAREFIGYCKVFKDLPSIDTILASPNSTPIPSEPSARFAVAAHIAEYMTLDNATVLMDYIVRLPVENQVIACRTAISKNKKLLLNDAFDAWSTRHATRKVA